MQSHYISIRGDTHISIGTQRAGRINQHKSSAASWPQPPPSRRTPPPSASVPELTHRRHRLVDPRARESLNSEARSPTADPSIRRSAPHPEAQRPSPFLRCSFCSSSPLGSSATNLLFSISWVVRPNERTPTPQLRFASPALSVARLKACTS